MQQRIEEHDQIIVSNWLLMNRVFFTISPAGMINSPRMGKRLKSMGYKAGTPDIMIFEPKGMKSGMFVELKRDAVLGKSKGKQSPAQKEFAELAKQNNYHYVLCYGSDNAIKEITRYLNGEII